MLRSRLRASGLALTQSLRPSTICQSAVSCAVAASRPIHVVPELKSVKVSDGIHRLMSPNGLKLAWSDYMRITVEKLNTMTAGTEFSNMNTKTIALMTARDPGQAAIFNYASMAHNHHFFFESIAPAPVEMPKAFRKELEVSFSSIETLRREILASATAMFGPGFVWLVKTGPGSYRVMNTYLAGSPYAGAHWRAQPVDMNTLGDAGSARSYMGGGRGAQDASNMPPGGIDVQPLLCINTWEHVWMPDWGLDGKAKFVEAWWGLVNWDVVWNRAGGRTKLGFKGGVGETDKTSGAAESVKQQQQQQKGQSSVLERENSDVDMRDMIEPESGYDEAQTDYRERR